MSSGNQEISLRAFVIGILLGTERSNPHFDVDMAQVITLNSMRFGIAVGAQFPTKVLPIMRQVSGADTESAYEQMRVSLEQWVSSNESKSSLESFPLILEFRESLDIRRINTMTSSQTIMWAGGTFIYGLLMGSLHRELFLSVLESSMNIENAGWELLKGVAPADLQHSDIMDYSDFLQMAKEMVEKYEVEQVTLS